MAQRADDIRHEIAETRAAMTAKLALLEERVRETAAGVQVSVEKIVEDVGGIVENVKATVDTTLAAVRQGAAGTQASVEKIMEDVGGIVQDVRATVEDVGGIVQDVRATVDTTLATVDTTLIAVRQGVAGTQASVGEMVEHVKGTVGETVATVQRTFDLPAHAGGAPPVADGGRGTADGLYARKMGWWPPVCGWLSKGHPWRRGFQTWKPPRLVRVVRSSRAAAGESQRYAGSGAGRNAGRNCEPHKRRCGSRDAHTP